MKMKRRVIERAESPGGRSIAPETGGMHSSVPDGHHRQNRTKSWKRCFALSFAVWLAIALSRLAAINGVEKLLVGDHHQHDVFTHEQANQADTMLSSVDMLCKECRSAYARGDLSCVTRTKHHVIEEKINLETAQRVVNGEYEECSVCGLDVCQPNKSRQARSTHDANKKPGSGSQLSSSIRERANAFSNVSSQSSVLKETQKGSLTPQDSAVAWNHSAPFPRWGDQSKIQIDSLLKFARDRIKLEEPVRRAEHLRRDWECLVEFLYVVDWNPNSGGVWIVDRESFMYTSPSASCWSWVGNRTAISNKLFQLAWEMLTSTYKKASLESIKRWPFLHSLMETSGSFPFMAYFGDSWICCRGNWGNNSIPLFTLSAPVHCDHAFPMPSYRTFNDSKLTQGDWDQEFKRSALKYPWEVKLPLAAWRGSLFWPANRDHIRWRLSRAAFQANAAMNKSQQSPWFDVGFSFIHPKLFKKLRRDSRQVSKLLPLISPQDDFQKYRAILDVDGNSWSERFGNLLCYNSVVLKVDPEHVDYFYFIPNDHPIPWKHYIPVKGDLSDLLKNTQFALDPVNDVAVREIVSNANSWCQRRLVETQQAADMLDIWEKYIVLLNQGGQDWEQVWNYFRSRPDFQSAFNMKRV